MYTTREILLEEENLKEGERELEKFYLRKRICESRPGLEVQGCISCSATFDSPPNDSEWMSIARKAENRETQAASKSPEPAGRTCVGLDLPVYRHYENSLHVASKERSRIRHMPTFGLINRSYIRCFRRTHKVCLVITKYSHGIPGSSPTQKSTSKQLYN